MTRLDRAKAVLAALDGGVVAERPRYRPTAVMACQSCGHRFAIADAAYAERRSRAGWNCKCGGVARVTGYWARLDPIKRKVVDNG